MPTGSYGAVSAPQPGPTILVQKTKKVVTTAANTKIVSKNLSTTLFGAKRETKIENRTVPFTNSITSPKSYAT